MKAHIFMALGLTIAAIFIYRLMEVMSRPELGWRELYIIGGFIFAGCVFRFGWIERRNNSPDN